MRTVFYRFFREFIEAFFTLLKKIFTIELIAEITGLSPEEIRALSQQMADDKH